MLDLREAKPSKAQSVFLKNSYFCCNHMLSLLCAQFCLAPNMQAPWQPASNYTCKSFAQGCLQMFKLDLTLQIHTECLLRLLHFQVLIINLCLIINLLFVLLNSVCLMEVTELLHG